MPDINNYKADASAWVSRMTVNTESPGKVSDEDAKWQEFGEGSRPHSCPECGAAEAKYRMHPDFLLFYCGRDSADDGSGSTTTGHCLAIMAERERIASELEAEALAYQQVGAYVEGGTLLVVAQRLRDTGSAKP